MDTSDAVQLVTLIILLVLSAFFSSAETALTTVNRFKMMTLAEDGNRKAKTVLAVIDNSPKMLSAILIGNNIVNLSASSLTTSIAYGFGGYIVGFATGILTFLILVFGEITPKTMATIYADELSLQYAGIIYVLMTILTPVIFFVNQFPAEYFSCYALTRTVRMTAIPKTRSVLSFMQAMKTAILSPMRKR